MPFGGAWLARWLNELELLSGLSRPRGCRVNELHKPFQAMESIDRKKVYVLENESLLKACFYCEKFGHNMENCGDRQ